jgi:hypothetical protein
MQTNLRRVVPCDFSRTKLPEPDGDVFQFVRSGKAITQARHVNTRAPLTNTPAVAAPVHWNQLPQRRAGSTGRDARTEDEAAEVPRTDCRCLRHTLPCCGRAAGVWARASIRSLALRQDLGLLAQAAEERVFLGPG